MIFCELVVRYVHLAWARTLRGFDLATNRVGFLITLLEVLVDFGRMRKIICDDREDVTAFQSAEHLNNVLWSGASLVGANDQRQQDASLPYTKHAGRISIQQDDEPGHFR